MLLTGCYAIVANMLFALFSSNLVIALKFLLGIDGAFYEHTKAFVLQGFPTTHTFTVFLATLSSA